MLIEELATPLIWTPQMLDDEYREMECERMFARSQATADMLAGRISFDDFCEVLNDSYIDVDACLDDWERGRRYM